MGEGDAGRDRDHTTDSQRDPQAPIVSIHDVSLRYRVVWRHDVDQVYDKSAAYGRGGVFT
jgi:hypothetical protein